MIERAAFVLGLSVLWGCSGTETGNPPVIGFGNSGCRKDSLNKGVALQSLDEPDARYAGLTCLAWEKTDTQIVQIKLTNYESGCGSDMGWKPLAELRDDGGLDLILEDKDCSAAACGWCTYDLSFTVELADPVPDGEVRVYQRGCGADSKQQKRASLLLGSTNAGAACNYAHAVALSDFGRGYGSKGMPCDRAGSQPARACDEGLSCTDVGGKPDADFSGGSRCLQTCRSEQDCDSLTSCQSGVCRLTATGLSSVY